MIEEESRKVIEVFYAYSRKDEILRNELDSHLNSLKREGLITTWYDGEITAGTEWGRKIDEHLLTSQLILLFVSPDFMNSDYCYQNEMRKALIRHEEGKARVIPIILRHVDWKNSPIGKLQALPKDGKPVASWKGRSGRDKAYLDIVFGIRRTLHEMRSEVVEDQVNHVPYTGYLPYKGTLLLDDPLIDNNRGNY